MRRTGRLLVSALILFGFCFIASPAAARDWYVDGANGSDEYSAWRVHRSFERAYRTLGQAVGKADAGDVVHINAGTYQEYVSITKPLTIIGEGEVVIDGQGTERSGVSIDRADGTILRNLTFSQCAYGVYIYNSEVTIEGCVFKDNAGAVFIYNPDCGVVAVNKCAFLRNSNGLQTYYYPGSVTVANCDFVGNGTALYRQWTSSAYAVDRSIFANNEKTFWAQDPAGGYSFVPETATACNLFENRAADGLGDGERYQPIYTVDPLFVEPAADNLHLKPGSPMLLAALIGAYGVEEHPPAETPAVEENAPPAPPTVATPLAPTVPEMPRRPTTITVAALPAEETAAPPVFVDALPPPEIEATPATPTETTQDQTPATEEPAAPATDPASGDTLAPESVLATDLPVGARRAVPETKITLTATDPAQPDGNASGVARIEYRVNGGNWMDYSAPFELREVMAGAERGAFSIGYRAVDNQGNIETEKTTGFEVSPALSASARLLTTPRVLCWWNEKKADDDGDRLPDREARNTALAAVFDSSALDYRIVESRRDFLAAIADHTVYLILGDREQLNRAGSAVLVDEVAAGKSVLSFGCERIATPADNDRGWENIFGIKVAGTLHREALLGLKGSALGDTRSIILAGKTAKVTEILAGEVWGEAGEIEGEDRDHEGDHRHGRGHDDGENEGENADTWPAIVAGVWEQGKTLYASPDYGRNQAALADVLRRAILWAEPAGAPAQAGGVVAVGVTVKNEVLPQPLQIEVEAEPPAGSAVTRVYDDGRASNVVVWYDDLEAGAEKEYRFLLRLPNDESPCRLGVWTSYVKNGIYRLVVTVQPELARLGEPNE